MNRLSIAFLSAAAVLSLPMADDSFAEDTTRQLREQQLGIADSVQKSDDEVKPAPAPGASEILAKFERFNQFFQLMDLPDAEGRLQDSLKKLQQDPRVVENLTSLYKLLSEADGKEKQFLGEARWRALYLMGELRNKQAAGFLFDIASASLPNPERIGEAGYKTEYRLRARAIDGLEKLKDVDQLRKIHEAGGVLSGLAAASLFELGQPPRGVTKVDGVKVLGLGDPKDFNPPKGSAGGRVTPGLSQPESDDQLTITPRWPAQK
jgi:hypothetical protein